MKKYKIDFKLYINETFAGVATTLIKEIDSDAALGEFEERIMYTLEHEIIHKFDFNIEVINITVDRNRRPSKTIYELIEQYKEYQEYKEYQQIKLEAKRLAQIEKDRDLLLNY